jgi:hypothetical protein
VANVVEEHLILGVDERGLEIEKSRWLTENPSIKVVETIIQKEPPCLLARIGGKYVPRVSMLVRFTIMHSETLLSPPSPPSGRFSAATSQPKRSKPAYSTAPGSTIRSSQGRWPRAGTIFWAPSLLSNSDL